MSFIQKNKGPQHRLPKSNRDRKVLESSREIQRHVSVNGLKKKIRDVSRLLERSENLRADIRIEYERALAASKHELATAEADRRRQKMIKKYHMVRFFERQKATRILKKLQRRLAVAASTSDAEALKAEIHTAEVDLNYTLFYPLDQKYTSLYAGKDITSAENSMTQGIEGRQNGPMWREIERRMGEGSLDELRNGSRKEIGQSKSRKIASGPVREEKRKRTDNISELANRKETSLNASDTRQEGSAEESDGGFFEE
ncbi:hypothetical protein L228DRAFT_283385 [Xylona heveae TC161]|uniref:rRNA-processing protein EFG1 n=1 Tax=Xylona heveae (strain CBS 132557 / TC161) TaxID=1328760 RepID=A0A165GIA3_XYLHT|nr:hypothetical protein L228DRAFT_283385 [Xylona heveae TC161]KZF22217.1 hypothetical protein L228DRAFT_283385 [Xylona heveae TC161]